MVKMRLPAPTKIYKFLRKRYLIILAVIFALLICLNALFYYQFVYRTIKYQPEITIEQAAIDQEIFDKVLNNLELRLENLSRVRTIQYFDPFND